jgi:hypothetical protein
MVFADLRCVPKPAATWQSHDAPNANQKLALLNCFFLACYYVPPLHSSDDTFATLVCTQSLFLPRVHF